LPGLSFLFVVFRWLRPPYLISGVPPGLRNLDVLNTYFPREKPLLLPPRERQARGQSGHETEQVRGHIDVRILAAGAEEPEQRQPAAERHQPRAVAARAAAPTR